MNIAQVAQQRLYNQGLANNRFENAAEVVQWLGAVQSQDYAGAKWALSLRLPGIIDTELDTLFNDGKILRTHVMRPTWHFVHPADIRWLLELTAPRVNAFNAYYYRQLGLDEDLHQRSNAAIIKALQGGQFLTRAELANVLLAAGIPADGMRLGYIVHRAELDAVICSGPRRGKQFTYALLDERAPQAKSLPRDEALAELVRRYFTSHGPATVQDFAWWSGLTVNDTKLGIDMIRSELAFDVIDGDSYWFAANMQNAPKPDVTKAYLLPNYDEYTVAYTERNRVAIYSPPIKPEVSAGDFIFSHTMVMDGYVVGSWRRTFEKRTAIIEMAPFAPLSESERQAFEAEAERYSKFLKMGVQVL